ncbi:MAG: RNA polymerase subunit sigma [Phycisphaerae bacterium SG8_4]|nr:MAG: RNA polymerase subunit sigma [Phycisphaerae bacterium SG8_4]
MTSDVTRILNSIEGGDPQAADELLPLVYEQLRVLAAQKMAEEKPGQTLQATALVHEAYLRLVEGAEQNWNSRGHFFKAAAEAMRRILVESARRKGRIKRGGSLQRVEMDECASLVSDEHAACELVALDEALDRFAQKDKLKADLVKLRYFAGLTIPQAAQILNISHATAERHWIYARCWLRAEIDRQRDERPPE